ncbi:hypothetical protein [Actinomadura rugatobispora]|uniref:Glycosyl hydrolase family 32 n=1 Tax=Actinomadura rugatobispora TaxID=1994 RepID=A0ABW1A3J1_9ACTN
MNNRQSDRGFSALLPRLDRSVVAIEPPGEGEGYWAGAPSAVEGDGWIYLAYRLRRPIGEGRGYAVAIARSADGERFEQVAAIGKDEMDAESLERPALTRTPEGTWRLYLSCATTGTKHWRVEVLEAADPAGFDARNRRVVLPGDARTGVKDPVIVRHGGVWHLWASCHPLAEADEEDRMVTRYATSADGLEWSWHGTALGRRAGAWDARGVRVSAVRFTPDGIVAAYDGRASAAENYEERTGIATGRVPQTLTAQGTLPWAASPFHGGGLRYLEILRTSDGRDRLFYEVTRADGAHELRAELR